ncbi:MAG: hypothetical protein H6R45_283 [Proteobacteria bacterium]|nr:hypothetical protein [Pseudomonadota bacterium]
MKNAGIIALLVLTAAVAASAAENGGDANGQAEAKKEKLICRTERGAGLGARVKRTCMTKAQWDELAERSKKVADEMGRSGAEACRLKGSEQMTSPCN